MSLPSRERGLKSTVKVMLQSMLLVAPFAGAWIEIPFRCDMCRTQDVAPFAGAWIEIVNKCLSELIGV